MRTTKLSFAVSLSAALFLVTGPSIAQEKGKTAAGELTSKSQAARAQLAASVPLAKMLESKAHAVLVFPEITKAGLGIGGQYGEGALLKGETRPPTTRRPALRLASRLAGRNTATRCTS